MITTKHQLKIQNYSLREQMIDKESTIAHLRDQLSDAIHTHTAAGMRLKLAQTLGHLDPDELERKYQWVMHGMVDSKDKEGTKL